MVVGPLALDQGEEVLRLVHTGDYIKEAVSGDHINYSGRQIAAVFGDKVFGDYSHSFQPL